MYCVHVQFPDVWACYVSVWEIKKLFIRNLLVRQVFINHNRINWFLMSEEMKLSNPCTPLVCYLPMEFTVFLQVNTALPEMRSK